MKPKVLFVILILLAVVFAVGISLSAILCPT
jgi:hypothetical protein